MFAQTLTVFARKQKIFLTLAGLILFSVLLVRTGWAAEDSYISFRVVDNFLAGQGLVWNLGERVQAYTDPLYVFLVIAVTAVTRSAYWSAAIVSFVLSLAAYLLLFWRRHESAVLVGTMLLVCSKAFMDFQVSGLENPATTLGIVAFCWAYQKRRDPFLLTLIASLIALNRLDSILLVLPPLILVYFHTGRSSWRPALLGLAPLVAWEAFATFYYGFPFPNTAYAKLGTGISSSDLMSQGIKYFGNSLHWDKITLPVIVIAVFWGFAKGNWPFSIGLLIQALYVLRIGGDFMSGRFFTAPFVLACSLLIPSIQVKWREAVPWSLCILLLCLKDMNPPLTDYVDSGTKNPIYVQDGIADERAYFYQSTGLLRWRRDILWPSYAWAEMGMDLRQRHVPVYAYTNIGVMPYVAGPGLYVIDTGALADAFLARIPSDPSERRPGHYFRPLPEGYVDSKITGKNLIQDPRLAKLYDHLETVIAGPLWNVDRIEEIWNFNTGRYSNLAPHL